MNRANLQKTMAILVLGLVIMSIFLYVFGNKIIGHFLSQDYQEAACDIAIKQAESLTFEDPLTAAVVGTTTIVGGVIGCVGGALGTGGFGTVAGCKIGATAGGVLGGIGSYIVMSEAQDVNAILQSGMLERCGPVLPPISGTKSELTVRIANASLLGCELTKLLNGKDRVTLVRSVSINVTDGDISFNDVKTEMDNIYSSHGIAEEDRCYLIWRINDTAMDCGEFRLDITLPDESDIATGELKMGEPTGIRMNYCKDRFMRTNKSFIAIIGNVTR